MLEDATVENGCTHIVPGSHNLPYVGVPQPNGGGTWMDEHAEFQDLLGQSLPIPMLSGSVLLFNAAAFHCVGVNTTDSTRISVIFGFRPDDELEYQPDMERLIYVLGEHIYRGNDR